MNTTDASKSTSRIIKALEAEDPSTRVQAALAAGSRPEPHLLDTLIYRCSIEPDFFVRDMLSWALTRLPPQITLPRIREELASERDQARSQALHTLSKVKDSSTWTWITQEMLHNDNDEVARTAWRAAVVLVPEQEKQGLAEELVRQFGRGDRSMHLSLSRALVDLGRASEPAVEGATDHPDPAVAAHARATQVLRRDPQAGFDEAIEQAQRVLRLGASRAAEASTKAADARAATGRAPTRREPSTRVTTGLASEVDGGQENVGQEGVVADR